MRLSDANPEVIAALSDALFDKALDAVKMAAQLFDTGNQEFRAIIDAGSTVPGEYKAGMDLELHEFFIEALRPAGIPVISEESSTGHPHIDGQVYSDPLDAPSTTFARGRQTNLRIMDVLIRYSASSPYR